MSNVGYFFYLADGTAEFLGYFGLVTIPLFLGASGLVTFTLSREETNRRRIIVACLAPAFIPFCVLTVGIAFFHPGGTAWRDAPPVPWFTGVPVHYPTLLIRVLVWLHVPLALALAFWARRAWPAVLTAGLWWGCVSFCAGIMASMSVTGIWL